MLLTRNFSVKIQGRAWGWGWGGGLFPLIFGKTSQKKGKPAEQAKTKMPTPASQVQDLDPPLQFTIRCIKQSVN